MTEDEGSFPHPPDSGSDDSKESSSLQRSEQKKESGKISNRFLSRRYLRTTLWAGGLALFVKIFIFEAYGVPSSSMENTLLVGDCFFVDKFSYGATTPRTIPLTHIRIPHRQILPALRSPSRNDVIVFESTSTNATEEDARPMYYVKRCIALPGDTVEIAGKQVFINRVPRREVASCVFSAFTLPRGNREEGIFPKGFPYNRDWWGPRVVPYQGMKIKLTLENIDEWRSFIEREGHSIRFTLDGRIEISGVQGSVYTVERDYYFVLGDNRDNSQDSRYRGYIAHGDIIGRAMFLYWSWDNRIRFTRPFALLSSIRWDRIGMAVR
ncbi:MAG: signal peptidase I [Bacteroidota bacterium]|nr:signal peptidase I [Bacteroidota bacterium]